MYFRFEQVSTRGPDISYSQIFLSEKETYINNKATHKIRTDSKLREMGAAGAQQKIVNWSKLAAEPGFEPGLEDSKSPVLPLHNSANVFEISIDVRWSSTSGNILY